MHNIFAIGICLLTSSLVAQQLRILYKHRPEPQPQFRPTINSTAADRAHFDLRIQIIVQRQQVPTYTTYVRAHSTPLQSKQLSSSMNVTHNAPLETKTGLPWPTIILTGIVAAISYFVVNLVRRRRFYKDLVGALLLRRRPNYSNCLIQIYCLSMRCSSFLTSPA